MLLSKDKLKHAVNIIINELQKNDISAKWVNEPFGKEVLLSNYIVKIQTDVKFKQDNYMIKFGSDGELKVHFSLNPYVSLEKYYNSFDLQGLKLYKKILIHNNIDPGAPKQVKKFRLGVVPKKNRNFEYLKKWSEMNYGTQWIKNNF